MIEPIKLIWPLIFNVVLVIFLFLLVNGPLLRRRNIMEFAGNLRLAMKQRKSLAEGLASICTSGDREINIHTRRFYNLLKSGQHPRDFFSKSIGGWGMLPASMVGLLSSAWGKISDEKIVCLLYDQAVRSWSIFSPRYHRKHINILPLLVLVIICLSLMVFSIRNLQEIFDDMVGDTAVLTPYSQALLRLLNIDTNFGVILVFVPVFGSGLFILFLSARNILHVVAEPFTRFFEGCADRLIPFRQAGNERDFIMVFAACLDSGFNEKDALEIACDSMNNKIWTSKKLQSLEAMNNGEGLCGAMDKILKDQSLKWRLRNLLQTGSEGDLSVSLEPWAELVSQRAAAFFSVSMDVLLVALILMMGFFIGSFSWVVFDILLAGIRIYGTDADQM